MTLTETRQLGDLMAAKVGSVDPKNFPDETFDLYSIPAFDSGKPDVVTGSLIGSSKQIVRTGDILLSKIVPHIRRTWIVGEDRGRRIIASGEWIVFRHPDIFPPYLRHFLKSDEFHSEFMSTVAGVGGSLLRARPSSVSRLRIKLPGTEQQRRIAAILDQAEALRTKRRQALAKLETLTQSLFLEMFGDVSTNERKWPERRLGEMFDEPPSYGTMIPPSGKGRWLSLRVGNIQDWQLDLSDSKYIDLPESRIQKFSLKDGDVLLARAIASLDHLGKCVIAHPGAEDWAFDSHLMRLRLAPSCITPEYLCALLQTKGGRSLFLAVTRRSAVQFNVNTKEIKGLKIPVPPLPLQWAFKSKLQAVEEQADKLNASMRETDRLFASLQHRAFNGEL